MDDDFWADAQVISKGAEPNTSPAPTPTPTPSGADFWDDAEVIATGGDTVEASIVPNWAKQFGSGSVEGTVGTAGLVADVGDFTQELLSGRKPLQWAGLIEDETPFGSYAAKATEVVQPYIAEDDGSFARTTGEFLTPDLLVGGGLVKGGKMTMKQLPKYLVPTVTGAAGYHTAKTLAPENPYAQIAGAAGGAALPGTTKAIYKGLGEFLTGKAVTEANKQTAAMELLADAGVTQQDLAKVNNVNIPTDDIGKHYTTAELLRDENLGTVYRDFGGADQRMIGNMEKSRASAITKKLDDIGGQALDPGEMGKRVRGSIQKAAKESEKNWRRKYFAVDPEDTTRIPILKEKAALSDFMNDLTKSGAVNIDDLDNEVKALINKVQRRKDKIVAATDGKVRSVNVKTIDWIDKMRQQAWKTAERMDAHGKNRESSLVAKTIAQFMEDAQDRAVKDGRGMTDVQRRKLLEARAARRDYGTKFQDAEIKQILAEKPMGAGFRIDDSKVVGKLINGSDEAVERALGAAGKEKRNVKALLRRGVIDQMKTNRKGGTTLNTMKNFLEKKNKKIDLLFTPSHKKNLERVHKSLESQDWLKEAKTAHGNSTTAGKLQSQKATDRLKNSLANSAMPFVGDFLQQLRQKKAIKLADAAELIALKAAADPRFARDLVRDLPKNPGIAQRVLNRLKRDVLREVAYATGQTDLLEEPITEGGK